MKLGKRPASYDKRDLRLSHYLKTAALPPIPPQFGVEGKVKSWGMLGNDTVGDCAVAGAAHEHELWTAATVFGQAPFTDDDVLSDYTAISGYTPTNPSTDVGCDMHDVMKYRRNIGVVDSKGTRHKVAGYVWLEPGNLDHLLAACYLFGVVGVGIQFPDSAMDQFNAGQPWSVVGGAQIDGGHYIPCVAMRSELVVVTWGKLQLMTPTFYQKYNDESVALLSTEFLHGQLSPQGFNVSQLITDLGLLMK